MDSLRFCMITTFYPPYSFGGDGIFVHRLSNLLARHGHEVHVIHCIDSYLALNGHSPAAAAADERGITVHGLKSGARLLSPLATQQTGHPLCKIRKIRALLETHRFDVIHYHNISLVGGPAILRYGEGVKLYTLHDHWLVCPTHVLFKFNREVCTRPHCIACTLAYGRPPQLWRYTGLLRRSLRHVDTFLAPSEFTRQRHLAHGLDIPIVHLPHALTSLGDTEQEPTRLQKPPAARPFFLFAGRLEKLKGLQTVIPLFRDYDKADLVIAGDGNYRGTLEHLAQGSPRIRFLGRVPPAELKSLYARAVALIVPSITYETFGQVIVEAYSQQTPAIVRDLGALPEIVAQSGGGLVFHDDSSLLDAMDRLLADPALRHTLGQNGHRACSRWTEEHYLARYLDLIDRARSQKASARR